MTTLKERFDDKWITIPETGCWWWIAAAGGKGYAAIQVDKRARGAHRVSYELHKGEIPDDMCVCHTCDNPLCVNPDHLFLGTHADNAIDRKNKGRNGNLRGDKHPNTKLSEVEMVMVKQLLADGMLHREIAELFGVSRTHISNINSGHRRWK